MRVNEEQNMESKMDADLPESSFIPLSVFNADSMSRFT